MLYVFYGSDEFRRSDELRALRREMDSDGNLAHNTTTIERANVRSLTPGELRAACHAASFFAENRLVVVEGLLGRLGGGGRGRRARRGRNASSQEEQPSAGGDAEAFMDVLANLPETTTVVLFEEEISDTVAKSVPEGATLRKFEAFKKRDELRSWATQRAKAQGANFAPGTLERLVSLFDGKHLGELAVEIDKLATYASGRAITSEDVDELVSGALAYAYWDLTDSVIDGRADRALSVLRKMDAKDQPPQMLTYMLVRQYRQILLAQSLLRDGLSQAQIGSQMGLQGYPLQKVVEQATRYPVLALETAYRHMLESDVAVKTGVLDADAALEVLVVSLAELAHSPRRGAGARR
jgi:DNA polymerase III subunit delta